MHNEKKVMKMGRTAPKTSTLALLCTKLSVLFTALHLSTISWLIMRPNMSL